MYLSCTSFAVNSRSVKFSNRTERLVTVTGEFDRMRIEYDRDYECERDYIHFHFLQIISSQCVSPLVLHCPLTQANDNNKHCPQIDRRV